MQDSMDWMTGPDKGVLDHTGKPYRSAEGLGDWAIPPAYQAAVVYNEPWRNFLIGRGDAALRNDPNFALAIEQDPLVQRVLRERTDGVLSLKLQLWVEDDRDPYNKAVRDSVWSTIEETFYRKDMLRYLHKNGSWVGKTAVQPVYEWKMRNRPNPLSPQQRIPTKCPIITNWVTTDGDSIGFQWDGTPFVLVNPSYGLELPDAELTNTNMSRAVVLRGTWRDKFIVHRHQAGSIPYWHGDRSEAVFGIGIRNVIYYLVWLRTQLLSNVLDYAERTGLGLRIWRFQAGNEKSRQAVEAAARASMIDKTNILLPSFVTTSGKSAEAVEVLESSTGGANLLIQMLNQWGDELCLYVIGQTLSSGTEGAGLGGSGVAGMHAATKNQIIALDAENLAETITREIVWKVQGWQNPESVGRTTLRAEFETSPPNVTELMDNAIKFFNVGGEIPVSYLAKLAGVPMADEGEQTLSLAKLQQMQQMLAPQPVPGDGDGDGVAGESENPDDEDLNWLVGQMDEEPEMAGAL